MTVYCLMEVKLGYKRVMLGLCHVLSNNHQYKWVSTMQAWSLGVQCSQSQPFNHWYRNIACMYQMNSTYDDQATAQGISSSPFLSFKFLCLVCTTRDSFGWKQMRNELTNVADRLSQVCSYKTCHADTSYSITHFRFYEPCLFFV